MASRSRAWLRIHARALPRLARSPAPHGEVPARVLLPHFSRLGDTIMLTALAAKVRELWPAAEIVHVMPQAFVPLYAGRPYGMRAVGWDPRETRTLEALFALGDFDLALVNGDARYSWLAAAMGARRIVAFAGDQPAYKNWPVHEALPMPAVPMSWSDLVATLVPGPPPAPYRRDAWPAPPHAPYGRPEGDYAVLHVGASYVHKLWEPARWAALAAALEARGVQPVWSSGPGEEALVAAIPGAERHRSYAGRLSLAQLWDLLAHARLVVTPDTSALHMARAAFAPVLGLFGPSSPVLGGTGSFWRDCPGATLAIDPFACRDQIALFKRPVAWVRRCSRGLDECPRARCMEALEADAVSAAAMRLLEQPRAPL